MVGQVSNIYSFFKIKIFIFPILGYLDNCNYKIILCGNIDKHFILLHCTILYYCLKYSEIYIYFFCLMFICVCKKSKIIYIFIRFIGFYTFRKITFVLKINFRFKDIILQFDFFFENVINKLLHGIIKLALLKKKLHG